MAGAIVMYDVSSRNTFENVPRWLLELTKYGGAGMTIMLVGNKCDLYSQREVSEAEGSAFAENIGAQFIETSAKNGTNVELAFQKWATEVCMRGGSRILCAKCEKERKKTGDEKFVCHESVQIEAIKE